MARCGGAIQRLPVPVTDGRPAAFCVVPRIDPLTGPWRIECLHTSRSDHPPDCLRQSRSARRLLASWSPSPGRCRRSAWSLSDISSRIRRFTSKPGGGGTGLSRQFGSSGMSCPMALVPASSKASTSVLKGCIVWIVTVQDLLAGLGVGLESRAGRQVERCACPAVVGRLLSGIPLTQAAAKESVAMLRARKDSAPARSVPFRRRRA